MTSSEIALWILVIAGAFGLSILAALGFAWLMGEEVRYDYPANPLRDEWLGRLDEVNSRDG